MNENPFSGEYKTPFGVPPFTQIDTTDYMPAYIEGKKKQKEEIDILVNNKETPTFENTILAFDRSGMLLTKVSKVFFALNEANTNGQMQAIARQVTPLTSKHYDDIYLNAGLFARIKAVYDKSLELKLDSQQLRVTQKYFRDFERMGSN